MFSVRKRNAKTWRFQEGLDIGDVFDLLRNMSALELSRLLLGIPSEEQPVGVSQNCAVDLPHQFADLLKIVCPSFLNRTSRDEAGWLARRRKL